MRIIITCGGTGGHIFPAISLAQELEKKGHNDIIFIIDNSERAKAIIEGAGFSSLALDVPKMPYGFSFKWPSFIIRLIRSRFRAETMLSELNPDIAVGFGAYISGPVISAAKALGVKILLHEQNVVMGRANRLLLDKADRVCLSFEDKLLKDGKKFTLTGNPVRNELFEDLKTVTKNRAVSLLNLDQHKKTLLVLGGSAGASAVNDLLIEFSYSLTEAEKELIQIAHITGKKDLTSVSETYKSNGITYWATDFYERMAILYKTADLVICRSGATTIAEVCLFGIPAIFIPYPGAGYHQRENALAITISGGAVMLEQENLKADDLKKQVFSIINNEKMLKKMVPAMLSHARSDAAEKLADAVEGLTHAE